MRIRAALAAALLLVLGLLAPGRPASAAATTTPIQVYGAWHCGNDACTWATVRDMSDFDTNNHWLIDRGDGRPSVNLVILSYSTSRERECSSAGGYLSTRSLPDGWLPEPIR